MTAPFLPPGFRGSDSDINPLANGYIRFYAAQTTTPKAVYSDADLSTSLGTSVALNSAGAPVSGSNVPVLVYPGIGDYKLRYYSKVGVSEDPNVDTLIFEFDDYPGGVAEVEESTTGLPTIPVDSKTTAYTVVTGDRGNLINANPTGGSFAITLPSAVTVGDDFLVGFRHNGTANAVTIVATGSQVIRFQGNRAAFSLVGQGETLWLVSDGSDWIACGYVPPFRKATDPYFIVADRLTAPPASPDAGARYLINGTPTGAWSTLGFADEDIAEADGNGSWIKHTPAEGWLAFDADEKISLIFKDGAWENFTVDPGTSILGTLHVQDHKSSGTEGGTPAVATWTTSVLNTSVTNAITGSSLAANTVTLPAGTYEVFAEKSFDQTELTRLRWKTADDDSIIIYSVQHMLGTDDGGGEFRSADGGAVALHGRFTIAVETDFVLQYWAESATGSTEGLGVPASISSTVEVYASVLIKDLSALQGPKGDEGDPGADGLDGVYAYQFNTATSGDPGTGKILLNNATPASVTELNVHQTDANAAVLTAVIATWDNSTSTTSKARLRFVKAGSSENFFEFLITGAGTDEGDYWRFPVEYVSHGGTIANGNDIAVLVIQTGDIGDPGTTVPDISGLSAMTDLVRASDQLIVYDASTASHKKATPDFLGLPISIKHFGSVGDGSADDESPVDQFITASASGMGYVPPGTYKATNLVPAAPTNIRGAGRYLTEFKRDSDGDNFFSVTAVDGVSLSDLSFDNDFSTNSDIGHGVRFDDCDKVDLRYIRARNYGRVTSGGGTGVIAFATSAAPISHISFDHIIASADDSTSDNTNGIVIADARYSFITNSFAESAIAFGQEFKNDTRYSILANGIAIDSNIGFGYGQDTVGDDGCDFNVAGLLVSYANDFGIVMGEADYNVWTGVVIDSTNAPNRVGDGNVAGVRIYDLSDGNLVSSILTYGANMDYPVRIGGDRNYVSFAAHDTLSGNVVTFDSGAAKNFVEFLHPGTRTSVSALITNNSGVDPDSTDANVVHSPATGEYFGSLSGYYHWRTMASGATAPDDTYRWRFEHDGHNYLTLMGPGTTNDRYGLSIHITGTANVGEVSYVKGSSGANDYWRIRANGANQFRLYDGIFRPETDNDIDLGTTSVGFKNAYFNAAGGIYFSTNKVLGARATGWGAPTGTPTRTTFATGSVTLPQLAERVKALIDDLTTHGMIGT
jgi:hypothetical protein